MHKRVCPDRSSLRLIPLLFVRHIQIVDFSGASPLDDALEDLSNIDNVTVTHESEVMFVDDTAGILEVRYNITFDGDCVRGNIPLGDLTASCYASATSVLADVECR